jgi:hypothetical protein
LAYSLLSSYPLQYSIRFYYFAPIIPFIYFSCVVGARRILYWKCARKDIEVDVMARQGALAVALLIASGIGYLAQSPGPLGGYYQPWRYVLDTHAILGNQLLRFILGNGTVVAQNEFLAHLSNRRKVYEIPIPDYRQVDYLFADTTASWYSVHQKAWEGVLATGYYEILSQQDGYIVAHRRPPQQSLNLRLGNEMTLTGYSIVLTDTLRGGQNFRPIVEWQANRDIPQKYKMEITLLDAAGHAWASEDREPQEGASPTDQWRSGEFVGDQYTLYLPITIPTGDYRLAIAVHSEDGVYLDVLDSQGNRAGNHSDVATIHIEKNKASYTAEQVIKELPMNVFFVDMNEMRLLGYVPLPSLIHAGDKLPVGVYWRARSKPRGDYWVTVQLIDASGIVRLSQTQRPAMDTYPTTQWNEGEVLLDWHDLSTPLSLLPGDYSVQVVLSDSAQNTVLGKTGLGKITLSPN